MFSRVAQYYLRKAIAKVKERPTTLFEGVFYDIREKAKGIKEDMENKAVAAMQKQVYDEVTAKGYPVVSGDLKLGKYRGSRFVTSFKLAVKARDSKHAESLVPFLQQKFSPKWQLKSFEDGIANYNIR